MKKLFVLCAVFCLAAGMVTAENSISAGYSFGYLLESSSSDTTILSHGVSAKFETYGRNSNTGFYVSGGYYFPYELSSGGLKVNGSAYNSISYLTSSLGVAFKYKMGNIDLIGSTGLLVSSFSFSLFGISASELTVGINAELGMKIHMNSLFISLGSNFGCDVFGFATLNGVSDSGRCFKLSVRPYAGVGFTF